jgi:hypothetical protein
MRSSVDRMGQPVGVVEKVSATPGVVRFEANRNLTGQGHDRYPSYASASGVRPSAVLARRLFDTGRVDAVHVFANIVTVSLKNGYQTTGLKEVVEGLYTYYVEGFVPPALLMPEEPAAVASGADGSGPVVDSRIPAALLERSRLARERWKARTG